MGPGTLRWKGACFEKFAEEMGQLAPFAVLAALVDLTGEGLQALERANLGA